ncbi:DUF6483 family protein [Ethanoligenens harbinense]|uniref:Uncharacterized protein n=1 Tax=Ethanoligenens harbinense (strain DSM 18485 / JCM 12961 / CGMCC 1.5033 / YUAN-3) TaxID=663278 RepID=E6U6F2_ETHHY|nr:DUF6483 family protein [Ethanoligenens harbinense]ADU28022.1 hypothetical protein Ethha_2529 [Ethanoligenens harbinense YUAN-3]AVQ97042.1 hypothetical protein CXQ68_12995 [Ethanoligenens harbinense YUAN-3]AYF39703.1 hypothetical protein CXP51_12895 [Ethanoligenens harbinense]AYF42535.1 hypothetical protein CN246_13470 [Ethanoligenens harbinense]QCN93284.1 hypothetical protein DRA42_13045 [Ethanoligenens harbinense]
MFENDYWMRQIEDITKALGNMLFEKQSGTVELFDEQGVLSETSFLSYRLNRMIGDGQINEAENLLFDAIEEDPKTGYLKVALDFYATLEKRSDAELTAAGFSRAEILDGLQAVQKIYQN